MGKKTYYGYWDNGNTYNREPYTSHNLAELKRTMRRIVAGNDTGSGGDWVIYDDPEHHDIQLAVACGEI